MPIISKRLLSRERLLLKRQSAERKRSAQNRPHVLHFFHQPGDPYSQLLASVLPKLLEKYKLQLETHLINAPSDSAVPERERLQVYSLLDAERLAAHYQIAWTFDKAEALQNASPTPEKARNNERQKKMGPLFGRHHLL